jgi:predicted nucleic acid-binding protein
MADDLIAGICLAQDGVLLTRNIGHFKRIDGLRLSGKFAE